MTTLSGLAIALILMAFIAGLFIGYVAGAKVKDSDEKLTPIQLFGMALMLIYLVAVMASLLNFSEVALATILTFIGGEAIGEKLSKRGKG